MSSYSSDDEESEKYTPPECIFIKSEPSDNADDKANVEVDLLPEKSRELYWGAYDAFIKWKTKKKIKIISEEVMLDYFSELSLKYKPSSLWCKYSMLRSTIEVKHNVKLGDFKNISAFLKQQASGYEPKKSKVLSPDNLKTFMNDAPDDIYLITKVAIIFGLFGGCRHCQLLKLSVSDIIDHGQIIQVKLRDTKSNARTFVIEGKPVEQVRAYRALRPKNTITDRFFLQYKNGKCTNQPLGKNKFGSMAKEIAEFLKLPDSELYSGHAFRKTALSTDRDITMDLKLFNGWESSTVSERYIEQSTKVVCEPELLDPLYLQKQPVQYREEAAHTKENVHRWVMRELQEMLSTVDTESTLEKLKKDKARFAIKLTELQLQNEPDNVRTQAQVAELMKSFELTNIQIKKLEKQIQESNEENRAKTRWDFISTVADAKEALKSLCEVMASNRKEYNLLKDNLMEKNEELKKEKDDLQLQCTSYKELLDNLNQSPKAKRKAVSSLLGTEYF